MLWRLSLPWKRGLFVDPTNSFESEGMVVTHSYADTIKALSDVYLSHDFRISAVYDNDEEYSKLFAGLALLLSKSRGRARPWLLVVDECDLFATPNQIDRNFSRLLRYGRHSAMSWAVACRADVQTHRDVRMNASEILLFRQGMLSPEMTKMLKSSRLERDDMEGWPEVSRLRLHGPDEPPEAEEGVHFIGVPDTFSEWFYHWETLAVRA